MTITKNHSVKENHAPEARETMIVEGCPVRKAMELVGGKWKLFIIQQIGKKTLRYGEIKRAIPDITEKMLIQELKSLVHAGILAKKSYGEIPPRVEYRLTEKGKKALPLLKQIKKFGEFLQESKS
jgi:DNA-binding HxlR family transcriptional regulator